MDKDHVKKIVKENYGRIAENRGCCRCGCSKGTEQVSKEIGYSDDDLAKFPEANMGLGCGNPTAIANIRPGDTVLDLGSGAGFDAFLAADKTGKAGKVIGVDMTEKMIEKARTLALKHGHSNVEFRLGDIESLPVESGTIDVIISNCVINLAPDKSAVFGEAHMVLRPSGRMFVSDIVLLEEITGEQRNDHRLLTGCVAGALLKDDYIRLIEKAGFEVRVISENKGISKEQYQGIPLESLAVEATKK
ncbi:MAG: arsenite methyltransferase [Candidatus Aenigmarchaeota archaeon]|nr:arsenite methyltransferase [Candidatus Aenigmarchaeota archaeon]